MDENGLGDIAIQFTGLRPGEKLYVELLIDAGNVEKTEHERILKSYENFIEIEEIRKVFDSLKIGYMGKQSEELYLLLKKYVDGYSKF